jgi:DNA-binding IclR family transcriptional regulator
MATMVEALEGSQGRHRRRGVAITSTGRQSPYAGSVDAEPVAYARQGIQSVENAMTVLLALERGAGPMTLTQVAEGCGMQASKVHRYLVSLGRVGLVSQSPRSGRYDLGPSMRRLGAEALRRMDDVGLASEYLADLRDRTRHAVALLAWGENGPVAMRWEYGAYPLPITVRVGSTLPVLTTSAGQVFLTYLPDALTEPIVQAARAAHPAGPSVAELSRIKNEVRRQGFAVTTDAMIPGATAVAAPVFATEASLPLVVVIVLPRSHNAPAVVSEMCTELLATTKEISAELGYLPSP